MQTPKIVRNQGRKFQERIKPMRERWWSLNTCKRYPKLSTCYQTCQSGKHAKQCRKLKIRVGLPCSQVLINYISIYGIISAYLEPPNCHIVKNPKQRFGKLQFYVFSLIFLYIPYSPFRVLLRNLPMLTTVACGKIDGEPVVDEPVVEH